MSEKRRDDDAFVANYLADTPDFFCRHLDVLASLKLPHECGGAVSLLEKQVEVLRGERKSMKMHLEQMLETSRDNQQYYECLHKMMLALISNKTLNEAIDGIAVSLLDDFRIDVSIFYLRSSLFPELKAKQSDHFRLIPMKEDEFDDLQKTAPDLQGRVCRIVEDADFFETINVRHELKMTSCAWVALQYEAKDMGVLVVGGKEKERFHADMDTFFLSNFAESLSCKLKEFIY